MTEHVLYKTLRIALIIGMVISVVLPIIVLLVWSFAHRWLWPNVVPESIGGRAWAYVFSPAAMVGRAFLNSTVIALFVTMICVALGVPAGRAIGMSGPKRRGLLTAVILIPIIVPSIAVAMGLHVIMIRLRLTESIAGVVIVHLIPALPYMIAVMSSVFSGFNANMELQARSLGAGPLDAFFRVTVPSVLPGIVTGALFAFLISWTQYILTLLIGGGRVQTLPVLLFAFASAGDTAVTAALSIVFLLPALIILVFTGRYIRGASAGVSGLGSI